MMERNKLTNNIKLMTAIATILAFGVGAYQIGSGHSKEADIIRVNIQNSLQNAVSSLPEDKKPNAEQVIKPVLELVAASDVDATKQNEKLEKASEGIVDAFSNLSIVSYIAEEPPFVPPIEKVQYVCNQIFSLAFVKKYPETPKILVKINGRTYYISPGDVQIHKDENNRVEVTYLEYSKELNGPVLNYSCFEG